MGFGAWSSYEAWTAQESHCMVNVVKGKCDRSGDISELQRAAETIDREELIGNC